MEPGTSWTLPGWARPVCEGIVANAAMSEGEKYFAITHQLGLTDGASTTANQPAAEKRRLTNDYVLGLIPEGGQGIPAAQLRERLAGEGFDRNQIGMTIGRLLRPNKQGVARAVDQGGVLFRAPAQQTADQQTAQTQESPEQRTGTNG